MFLAKNTFSVIFRLSRKAAINLDKPVINVKKIWLGALEHTLSLLTSIIHHSDCQIVTSINAIQDACSPVCWRHSRDEVTPGHTSHAACWPLCVVHCTGCCSLYSPVLQTAAAVTSRQLYHCNTVHVQYMLLPQLSQRILYALCITNSHKNYDIYNGIHGENYAHGTNTNCGQLKIITEGMWGILLYINIINWWSSNYFSALETLLMRSTNPLYLLTYLFTSVNDNQMPLDKQHM